MSRKQRRGFGPPGAKPAFGIASSAANSPAALFNAAVAHHQTGALIEAERQYRHILTLAPNHADSLHNLGLIALQGGNATSAVELIGKAIAANPLDVEAALVAYEKDLFPRSASAAAEADRNLKLFFDDNAPQSVVDLFTNYQSVKCAQVPRPIEPARAVHTRRSSSLS